jgi:polyferredoxin
MRKVGLIFILIAVITFVSTLFLNDYEFHSMLEFENKTETLKYIDAGYKIGNQELTSSEYRQIKFEILKRTSVGFVRENAKGLFYFIFGLGFIGSLFYFQSIMKKSSSEQNLGVFHRSNSNRGWIAYLVFGILVLFYVLLYWFPYYLVEWTLLVDPIARLFNSNGEASHWFLYGFLYCYIMTIMGVRMLLKYRHNNYQIIRTISVWFFQVVFAFTLPEILANLNGGWAWIDLKNMWPLDYDFFNNGGLITYATESSSVMVNGGGLGIGFLLWGIALFVIGVPVLVYFFGKRWYCSWVCGCGGLAETLGDPYRHLSDNSLKSWKIERWLIHGVLLFAIIMTLFSVFTMFTANWFMTGMIQEWYGFLIGSVFAGVVGTGFYPVFGNRVWCRFGCPLAAWLGFVQRFKSRFRVTTNGGQCISCGNCSTHCEMGIDVKWYAQRGQDIKRSSCVGCGICSEVCPRGVLNLENGPISHEEGEWKVNNSQ